MAEVVGLDGQPIVPASNTDPAIVTMLEEALAAAKTGHMAACAIATVMAHGESDTVTWAEPNANCELLGSVVMLQHRLVKFIEKG